MLVTPTPFFSVNVCKAAFCCEVQNILIVCFFYPIFLEKMLKSLLNPSPDMPILGSSNAAANKDKRAMMALKSLT